jgi:hypothetical protein
VELSRVVVLASRPVEGNTISQLIDNQTLLLREVHLDGQGRFTRVVARTGGRLWLSGARAYSRLQQ